MTKKKAAPVKDFSEDTVVTILQVCVTGVAICFGIWCVTTTIIKTVGWDDPYALAIAQCNEAKPTYYKPGDSATELTMDDNIVNMIQACHEQVTRVYMKPVPELQTKSE